MTTALRLLACIAPLVCLAACVGGNASVQTAGGLDLTVTQDDMYLWPADMPGHPEVDVFPLVTALVVARRDGVALTEADEPAAREAVTAFCADQGLAGSGPSSRFADGAWAFYPCQDS